MLNNFKIILQTNFKNRNFLYNEIMTTRVQEIFGNRLRLRVCGICVHNGQILLVNHLGLGQPHFWAPPGGGVQTGEPAHTALIREFTEETGLTVEVRDFLFACEFIQMPLHAVELFFQVRIIEGNLAIGLDPELGDRQIIKEVRFFDDAQIRSTPLAHLHGIFKEVSNIAQIGHLRGYFKL